MQSAGLQAPASTTLTTVSQRATAKSPASSTEVSIAASDDKALEVLAAKKLELEIALSALLKVSGPESAQVARTANFFFRQMLSELDAFIDNINQAALDKLAHMSPERGDIPESLRNDMGGVLHRQPSLLADLTDAESLLENGVEAYVGAMRKLLKVNDASVEIALKDFSFSALVPGIPLESDTRRAATDNTVGQRCFMLLCGLCVGAHRVVQRLQQRIQSSSLTRPLLASGVDESKPHMLRILQNVTVSIKPSHFTLVLGPPGCGKTTFLKALSGGLHRSPGVVEFQGSVTYNGRPVETLQRLANWVAYVSQEDEHMPLLTTRETLEHAFKCRKEIRYTDEGLQNLLKAKLGQRALDKLMAFKDLDVDVALAVLGLKRCADTVLGNDTLKGVSGGERRRITLGEMLVTGSSVLCLDEISTGLDSAATFDICQYLRAMAHIMDQCVVVALLQPPPEVIQLFDDVIVLAEGHVVYHGERARILEYFEGLGFTCPPRKDLGDFLAELPTHNGAVFALDPTSLKELGLPPPPTTPSEFAERWRQSDLFKSEAAEVTFHLSRASAWEHAAQDELDIDRLPENSWHRQLWLAMAWFMQYRLRDKVKLRAKLVQNLVMGALFGTLFYQIPFDEAYQKNMLIFNVLQFSAQSAIPEVQANSRARNVYYKHVDQRFYKGWQLALAQSLTNVPFVCADMAIFGNMIYWLTGLDKNLSSYAFFVLISVLYGCTMQTIMGIFPYLIRDENFSVICAVMVLITMILVSGIVATENVIPIYLKPLFFANPLAWSFRALANVEFLSPKYNVSPCKVSLGGKSLVIPQECGHFFLAAREIRAGWEFVYEAIAVLFGFLVVFWFIQAWALTYVRFDKPRISRSSEKDQTKKWLEQVREDAAAPGSKLMRQESVFVDQMTLVVSDLGYSITQRVDGKLVQSDLLKNISMWALPGRMTALMGSSGAGKTTLLDVLAGIKTVGVARGQIFLNGRQMSKSDFTRVAGYVQQFGVHSPTATIRESVEFSAALRLGRDFEGKDSFVKETLKLLELDEIESQLAGACSLEQNKRLTLGVELVANPSIVFADEPTSGLDARAASIVMRVLQKVARSGRVVVATIHQPSIAIFNRFDDLLLLKRGGEVVFFGEIGPSGKNLIDYFEAIPGVPKCAPGANPAAWMLEVIGGGTGVKRGPSSEERSSGHGGDDVAGANDDGIDSESEEAPLVVSGGAGALDFANVYRLSELKKRNDQRMREEFGADAQGVLTRRKSSNAMGAGGGWGTSFIKALPSSAMQQYNVDSGTQLRMLLWRNFIELWRSPEFSFQRFVVVTTFMLMFVAIYFRQPLKNAADVQSHILCVSFSMSLVSMFTMMTIIPFTMNRRALFYRERGAGMYRPAIYALAAGIAELPYLFVTSMLAVNVVYWGVGFNEHTYPFVYFASLSFLYLCLMAFLGMLLASLLPEALSAQLAGSAFFSIMNVFAGITVPAKLIPTPYLWIHYFSPMRWFFEGVLATQFHGDDRIICNPQGMPVNTGLMMPFKLCTVDGLPNWNGVTGIQTTAEDFVLKDFLDGYKYENRWNDIGIICAWIVFLRVAATAAQVFISFDRR